jgi:hypothetical protein
MNYLLPCSLCKTLQNITEFKSEKAQREWYITRICQNCQDKIFVEPEEDLPSSTSSDPNTKKYVFIPS